MRALIPSILATLLVCACGTPPPDHFYTLIGTAPVVAPAAATSGKGGPSVLIASITLPESVDRSELVLRKGPNSVTIMDTHRWAESLKSAIPRVLANDLSPLLGGAEVATADDNVGHNARYLLKLDIVRFDTTLGGAEAVDAAWIIHPVSGAPDMTGTASLRVSAHGAGFDDAVAAHTQALAQLSGEIAKQIKDLQKAEN